MYCSFVVWLVRNEFSVFWFLFSCFCCDAERGAWSVEAAWRFIANWSAKVPPSISPIAQWLPFALPRSLSILSTRQRARERTETERREKERVCVCGVVECRTCSRACVCMCVCKVVCVRWCVCVRLSELRLWLQLTIVSRRRVADCLRERLVLGLSHSLALDS